MIYGSNTKGLGHLLARDEAEIDQKLEELDPILAQAQFKAAVRRLQEHGQEILERDGADALRALCEKIHLIAGDRRTKFVSVEVDRRRKS